MVLEISTVTKSWKTNGQVARCVYRTYGPDAALEVHAFIAAYPSMLVTKFTGV
jgi:hypothetical protein